MLALPFVVALYAFNPADCGELASSAWAAQMWRRGDSKHPAQTTLVEAIKNFDKFSEQYEKESARTVRKVIQHVYESYPATTEADDVAAGVYEECRKSVLRLPVDL
jgi:hypothetical protein